MVEESKARLRFTATAKGKRLEVHFGADGSVLFWDQLPIAVATGECTYYLDNKLPGGVTKAITEFAQNTALIRSAAGDFDFVLGALLTKVGLPLTRRS